MNYKLTALTPLLVGDGQELSPIDYMVWKDQINVLDQNRIFKLLSRGPRLDGYLAQLQKAQKLDFASWGGFAQNFSQRRIPFEHPTLTGIWEKTPADYLFIPTFASNGNGQYVPGSALKGALRTGLVYSRWSASTVEKLASTLEGERMPRRLSEAPEVSAGASQVRILATFDSDPVSKSAFKVYLTRVANLDTRGDTRGGSASSVAWKVAGRGNVPASRINESTPAFIEMATPGTEFKGAALERKFLEDPQLVKALGWRSAPNVGMMVKAANEYAGAQLEIHARFAEASGLPGLQRNIAQLQEQLSSARSSSSACLLCIGWGAGFLSKSAFLETDNDGFRKLLRSVPAFNRALKPDVVFPKTRRVVFAGGQPAYLPGWAKLQIEE